MPLVGGGDSTAESGLDEPAFGADQVGGQERLLLETRLSERGAFLGLLDDAGRDGEPFHGVVMGKSGLFDFESDA